MNHEEKIIYLNLFFSVLSIAFFLLSLTMPAFRYALSDPWFQFADKNTLYPGMMLLLLGWYGLFGFSAAWLANPIGLISFIFFYRQKYDKALGLSVVAIMFALFSFALKEIMINEAGTTREIYSLGIGFYTWLLAITTIFIGSATLKKYKLNDPE